MAGSKKISELNRITGMTTGTTGTAMAALLPIVYDQTTYSISLSDVVRYATGYTGSRGYTGSQGVQGVTGYTGSIGYTGSQGSQGPIGYTGSASTAPGPQGIQGPIGYTGSASTVPGPTGPQGITGPQGPIGYTGSASTVPGPQGPQGPQGPVGPAAAHGYAEYYPGTYVFIAESSGVFITASAGGGGAAAAGPANQSSRPGGRGMWCTRKYIPTVAGQQYTIVVGNPGVNVVAPLNGDATGTPGTNTSFGNLLVLPAGGGAKQYYYAQQPSYSGTSYGSATLLSIDVIDPLIGRPFGSGGYFVAGSITVGTENNAPGRGFMIIEW